MLVLDTVFSVYWERMFRFVIVDVYEAKKKNDLPAEFTYGCLLRITVIIFYIKQTTAVRFTSLSNELEQYLCLDGV